MKPKLLIVYYDFQYLSLTAFEEKIAVLMTQFYKIFMKF